MLFAIMIAGLIFLIWNSFTLYLIGIPVIIITLLVITIFAAYAAEVISWAIWYLKKRKRHK